MTVYLGKTLNTLSIDILWELGQVIGTTANYDRFPASRIRTKLTDRQNDFVYQTKCLKKFALTPAVADQTTYRVPETCMESGIIAVKFFNTATSYEDLEVKDIRYMNDVQEGYLTDSSSSPEYAFQGNSYGHMATLEVYPAPDTSGTAYATGDDTGIRIGSTIPSTSNNTSGTATGGDSTSLLDTGTTLTTQGLSEDMYVRNVTDGSYSYISSIAANDITLGAALTGGTANVFAANDEYEILAGEWAVLTSWEQNDRYLFGYKMGALSNITIPANTFYIEYVPFPTEFPATGQGNMYPEIPKMYHPALVDGVVADFLGSFHEKTKEFQRAQLYEAKYQNAVAMAKAKTSSSPFRDKPVRIRPKK